MTTPFLFQSVFDAPTLKEEYIRISKGRIDQLANGTLKTRPLGQPVWTRKVAQVPLSYRMAKEENT